MFSSNPSYYKDFNAAVFNNSAGISCLNLTFTQQHDITNYMVSMVARLMNDGKNYDEVAFQSHINICNVAKGIMGSFVMKFLAMGSEQYSNFRYDCVQKKGFYYWYNFPVIDISMVPPFHNTKLCKWDLTIRCKAKFGKNAPPKDLFLINIKAETIPT